MVSGSIRPLLQLGGGKKVITRDGLRWKWVSKKIVSKASGDFGYVDVVKINLKRLETQCGCRP